MILVLVKSPNSFRIDQKDLQFVSLESSAFEELCPHPEPLGAGVDGRPDSESLVVVFGVNNDSVQQE